MMLRRGATILITANWRLLAMLVLATGLMWGASSAKAHEISCDAKTLMGGFGVTGHGVLVAGGTVGAVGRVAFDGQGRFVAKGNASRNGILLTNIEFHGRYRLDADCTGEIASDGGEPNILWPAGYFVFSPLHGELRLVASDPSLVLDVQGKRQFSTGKDRACSNADLKGVFTSAGGGEIIDNGMFKGVGLISFDGKDDIKVNRSLNLNGTFMDAKIFESQYRIAPDCTGEFAYRSEGEFHPAGPTTFDSFVVDDDGREVRILSANPGRVLTVIGEK